MSDVVERLIRYCAIPSQSDPEAAAKGIVPSTECQFDVSRLLAKELEELGAENVSVDEHAYCIAHWPASPGLEDEPALGFCCHVDTAFQSYGDAVRPQVLHYEGGELSIGTGRDGSPVTINPETNPELERMVGWDLVTSDGTSL
ncbi:MAG: peptidase T, partial [Atopobiaceae bacterium]|nr:peptidase T [Atopobiaceae bacterium]